ncbi:MAG: hypothetical protein GY765_00445, partial [bacterium]|nr:hypothetical protein [bacterium]
MKNVFYLSVMVLSVLHLLSCSNSSAPLEPDVKIGNVAIKHTPVTFNDKKVIPGYLNGVDFTKGIVFIERPFPDKRKWTIDLFTLDSHKLIRTLRLASGSFESPTLFYGPHHYENIGDKYVIVDQIHKFVFFDRDFNHLFSSRFHCYRFFVDFHTRNGEIYFVIGHRSSRGAGLQLLVEL